MEIFQSLVETQIFEPIDADLHPQEGRKLFLQAGYQVFAIDPQYMVPMIEAFQQTVQFARQPLVLAHPEDLRDLVGGEAEETQFGGALKDLVDRKVTPKNEIETVLDLIERILTPQVDGGPLLLGELGTQDQSPVVQALADDLGAEAIGGGLQRFRIRDGEEGVVILVETEALALQLPGDEGMTVNPVASLKRQKGTDAQDHGPEDLIAQVEIVVGIARPLPLDDAIVRILGRVLRRAGAEVGARFHRFEDEVHAEALAPFHGQEIGADVIFLPEAFLLPVGVGPLQGMRWLRAKASTQCW